MNFTITMPEALAVRLNVACALARLKRKHVIAAALERHLESIEKKVGRGAA